MDCIREVAFSDKAELVPVFVRRQRPDEPSRPFVYGIQLAGWSTQKTHGMTIVNATARAAGMKPFRRRIYKNPGASEILGLIVLLGAMAGACGGRTPSGTVHGISDPPGVEAAYVHAAAAEIHRENGDLKSAIASLEAARKADGDDGYLAVRLAQLHIEQGNTGPAASLVESAVRIDSENALVWRLAAECFEAMGDAERARAAAEEAIRLAPGDPAAPLWLAEMMRREGQPEDALVLLETLLETAPGTPSVHLALGQILAELGRDRDAVSHLEQVVEVNPRHIEARGQLAICYTRLGNPAAAAEQLSRVLEQTPENRDVRLETVFLYLDSGRPDLAERHIDTYLATGDESPAEGLRAARLYGRAERFYKARKLLVSESNADEPSAEKTLTLAAVEIALGRLEAAELLLDTDLKEPNEDQRRCDGLLREVIQAWPAPIPGCAFSVERPTLVRFGEVKAP